LPDSEVRLDNVLLNPQRTAFINVLRAMGAELECVFERVEREPVGFIVARSSALVGASIPADLVPSLLDEVPALAVAASRAEGRFSLSGAARLRAKERG